LGEDNTIIMEKLNYELSLQHKRAQKLTVIFKIHLDFVPYIFILIFCILTLKKLWL
jgi:hypothetical protein